MKRFKEQIVVVTGASGGIGCATVKRLHSEGATLIGIDANGSALEDLVQSVNNDAGNMVGIKEDLLTTEGPERAINQVLNQYGRIDVLINLVGGGGNKPVDKMTLEEWKRAMDLCLQTTFLCCKHTLPSMLEHGKGSIVNMSSINGIRGNTDNAGYAAGKAGVVGLTMAMALDYASRGIRVNAVAPGTIDTNAVLNALRKVQNPEVVLEGMRSKHPIGRIGKPEEVASAIAFLASEDASFITGLVLPVDGGRHIR